MSAPTDQFPRDTSGLPAATPAELVELAKGQRFQLRIAPVTKQLGDATVRMLAYNGSIPGPTLKVREGSEIEVDVVNDGDLEQTGALARPAPGQPLRRHPRDPGADPRRRPLLLPRDVPRSRRLLVPPAHPRGLRPGDGPLRQRDRRARGPRLLGAGAPGAVRHARRRAARRRPDRAVQPPGDQLLGDGPLRRHAADRRRAGARADRQAGRGGARLPDQHRQHARVQGRAARRPDEARRRRQRPRRARAVRRGRGARSVGAGRRRCAVRAARRARAGTPHAGEDLPPGHDRGRRRARRAGPGRAVRDPAPRPASSRPSASGSRRGWPPSRTRRWPSWPRWTSTPSRDPPSTSAPCTPRSSPRSRATARAAA